jgi:predicted HAD superfamily Cof-like phosphohydrolase
LIEQQKDIGTMMELYQQDVRPLPAMLTDPKERLLTANLVIEEALEFCVAMGFNAVEQEDGSIKLVPHGREPDLKEAADAIGDMLVVDLGAANRLGVNSEDVFIEVNRSNMSKTWPHCSKCDLELTPAAGGFIHEPDYHHTGFEIVWKIHKRPEDGKVIKPPSYSPADVAGVLARQKPLPFANVVPA